MKTFKVIIAGGRDFDNYELLKEKCDAILGSKQNVEIVSGTARGADELGERYAEEARLSVKHFPADWNRFGNAAGSIRNAEMAKYANALIAFWDGKSRGTDNMIYSANHLGLAVRVIRY